MKNIYVLLLLAVGLNFFSSCGQDTAESNQELQELARTVPAEDEDPTQYINNDEKFPKPQVSKELLASVKAYNAAIQAEMEDIAFRAHCGTACEGVEGEVIFCEDFDGINSGSVAENSIYFEQWNPDAQNDGQIVHSGMNKILRIDRRIQSQTHDLNEEDDIFTLGTADQGCYNLHFEMYIGNCRTAYFDLQKQLRQEVLAAFTFEKFGKAFATLPNGEEVAFNYPVGQWFDVDITFNANNRPFNPTPPFNMIVIPNENTLTIDIAGRTIGTLNLGDNIVNITGDNLNQLEGIDFYPLFRSSKFYLDNFCFTFLGDPSLGED